MTGSVQLLQQGRPSAAVCNPTNANKEDNLKIFNQTKLPRKSNVNAKIAHFKQHADLYEKAFVAAESRGLNFADLFAYESPPISTDTCNPWNNALLNKI